MTTSSLRASIAGRSSSRPSDLDPVLAEPLSGQVVELARVEQRLAGDAADVQARAAEARPLLDAGHLHPELRRADRRDIAARPGADHDQVITLRPLLAPCIVES